MGKGILWAVVEDRNSLISRFNHAFDGQVFCDHVTLLYNTVPDEYAKRFIGLRFKATGVAVLQDKDIQAIEVELHPVIKGLCQRRHPHITVSAREGIRPVQANELFATWRSDVIKTSCNFPLDLKIEFKPFK